MHTLWSYGADPVPYANTDTDTDSGSNCRSTSRTLAFTSDASAKNRKDTRHTRRQVGPDFGNSESILTVDAMHVKSQLDMPMSTLAFTTTLALPPRSPIHPALSFIRSCVCTEASGKKKRKKKKHNHDEDPVILNTCTCAYV